MKIANILKSNLAITHEQGDKIRNRIIKKLYNGNRVTVDFGGLVCVTTHFLSPITEITLFYPKDFLNQNIRIINISKYHAELFRRSIENVEIIKDNDNQSS